MEVDWKMSENRIKQVLILCTGNSCRSQMAEALINHFRGDDWRAFSAGTEPAGYVHPLAIRAMEEWGVDISRQESKSVDLFRKAEFDIVITVCDDAAEKCPLWLGRERSIHIGFRDPAGVGGTEQERMAHFALLRDRIGQRLVGYLGTLGDGQPKDA